MPWIIAASMTRATSDSTVVGRSERKGSKEWEGPRAEENGEWGEGEGEGEDEEGEAVEVIDRWYAGWIREGHIDSPGIEDEDDGD